MGKYILTLGQSNNACFQSITEGVQTPTWLDNSYKKYNDFTYNHVEHLVFNGNHNNTKWEKFHMNATKNSENPIGGLKGRNTYLPLLGAYFVAWEKQSFARFVNVAVGSTKIADWSDNKKVPKNNNTFGDISSFYTSNALFDRVIWANSQASIHGFNYTDVIINIGESDALSFTDGTSYYNSLKKLCNKIHSLSHLKNAKIFIALETLTWGGTVNRVIQEAQKRVINDLPNVYFAIITDFISDRYDNQMGVKQDGIKYRFDGIHMNGRGMLYQAYYTYQNMHHTRELSPV
jgi:lysophospholipase L1-like esterase